MDSTGEVITMTTDPSVKGPPPCLYDPKANLKWVCVDENNDVYNPDGSRVNLHVHCQWISCSCKHHQDEVGRDHSNCANCPKAKAARAKSFSRITDAPARTLRRPTPRAHQGEDSDPGPRPVVDGIRRRLVRPGDR